MNAIGRRITILVCSISLACGPSAEQRNAILEGCGKISTMELVMTDANTFFSAEERIRCVGNYTAVAQKTGVVQYRSEIDGQIHEVRPIDNDNDDIWDGVFDFPTGTDFYTKSDAGGEKAWKLLNGVWVRQYAREWK